MENKIATMVCGVVVAVLLITTLAVPVIANASSDSSSTIPNPEGHGITLALQTSNFNVDVDYTDNGDDTFTLNGETYEIAPQILFAWNNGVIYIDDDLRTVILSEEDGSSDSIVLSHFTVTIEDTTLVIDDEDETQVSFDMPSYVYTPDPDGKYSSWSDTTDLKKNPNSTVIAVGSFAGVDCYYNSNNQFVIQNFALGLVADADVTATEINSVSFKAPSDVEEFDPSVITIEPLDPSIITPSNPIDIDPIDLGGGNENTIMSVPTPTYTDGDWGYDVVEGNAKIVSYSGTGGNVTIPSTVGGYTVVQVGKDSTTGTGSNYLMNNSQLTTDTTLTFPASVQIIGAGAFSNSLSNLKGVVLPDGVSIGRSAFFNTGLTTINIPDNAIVYGYAFQSCQATSLNIGNNVKFAEGSTFKSCAYLDGTVNIPSTTTFGTTGGIFEGCSNIDNFIFPDDLIPCYSLGTFFYNCSGWVKNNLIIYDGVETVGYETFYGCRSITGKLIIPNSVKNISSEAFYNCRGFDTLISFMDSDSVIGTNPFRNTNSLKTILNFGTLELTTTSYGLNADVVQDHIDACSYLAPLEISTGSGGDMITQILNVVPLLMIIGVLMFVAGFIVYRRF